jgi:hypothetical protein
MHNVVRIEHDLPEHIRIVKNDIVNEFVDHQRYSGIRVKFTYTIRDS